MPRLRGLYGSDLSNIYEAVPQAVEQVAQRAANNQRVSDIV